MILRALEAGYEPISILMEKRQVEKKAGEVLKKVGDIPIYVADLSVLTQITGFQLARGMLCAMRRKPMPTVESICQGKRRIAILEEVVNPTNVGRHLPVGGSPWHGWHPFDPWLCRSFVSQSLPGQHGNGLSDSLDLSFQRGVL